MYVVGGAAVNPAASVAWIYTTHVAQFVIGPASKMSLAPRLARLAAAAGEPGLVNVGGGAELQS